MSFLPARGHFQRKLFEKAVCQGEGTPLHEAEMFPEGQKLGGGDAQLAKGSCSGGT